MPRARKDITGQRFGRLTAVRLTELKSKDGSKLWEFICDCGNTHYSTYGRVNHKTKSCGCLQKETMKAYWDSISKDLTGLVFGRLTVISKTSKRKKHGGGTSIVWLCTCDCGTKTEVVSNNLLSGKTQSCGCRRNELASNKAKVTFNLPENRKKAKENNGYIDNTCVTSLTQKISAVNKSGVKGVSWHKKAQKWVAQIAFKGVHYYLGLYIELDEAAKIRKQAEEMLFEPFLEWYKDNFNKEKKRGGMTCKKTP